MSIVVLTAATSLLAGCMVLGPEAPDDATLVRVNETTFACSCPVAVPSRRGGAIGGDVAFSSVDGNGDADERSRSRRRGAVGGDATDQATEGSEAASRRRGMVGGDVTSSATAVDESHNNQRIVSLMCVKDERCDIRLSGSSSRNASVFNTTTQNWDRVPRRCVSVER